MAVAGPAPSCMEAQAGGNMPTFDRIPLTDVASVADNYVPDFLSRGERSQWFDFAS